MTDFKSKETGKALFGLLVFGLIQVVVWALLVHFLSNGWWITAINVIGFLFTMVFIGLGIMQTLKIVMQTLPAFSPWFNYLAYYGFGDSVFGLKPIGVLKQSYGHVCAWSTPTTPAELHQGQY